MEKINQLRMIHSIPSIAIGSNLHRYKYAQSNPPVEIDNIDCNQLKRILSACLKTYRQDCKQLIDLYSKNCDVNHSYIFDKIRKQTNTNSITSRQSVQSV